VNTTAQRHEHLLLFLLAEFPYTEAFPKTEIAPTRGVREYLRFAVEAERAGFDAVFAVDFLGLKRNSQEMYDDGPFRGHRFEPLSRLSAIAAVTNRIGLIGTMATEFVPSYTLARQLTSLDALSGGRAGWNMVTAFRGEENFGQQLRRPETRYERAQEHVDIDVALWKSWRDGWAREHEGRLVFDFDRIHDLHHHGEHFDVEQALDLAPSPQRIPLLMQAGASESGLAFAARNAEVIYAATQTLEESRQYRADLDARLVAEGRHPNDARVLPGARIVLGTDDADAAARLAEIQARLDLGQAREGILREVAGLDLDGLDLDDAIPLDRFPDAAALRAGERRTSRAVIYREWVEQGRFPTLGALLRHYATTFGHTLIVGGPDTVADELEHWFTTGAADGFVLHRLNGWDLFIDVVMPRLRARGVLPPPPTDDELAGEPIPLRERLRSQLPPRHR
jgi:FMN-dependent oxidoreductase (nitrilotriacetate monooxygenase family)